ncbi:MAG: hypothetical protein ACW99J_13245 [Candidatus Thorarchaeota archaeon]
MNQINIGSFAVYLTYSLHAVGLAIAWQFGIFFVKHDRGAQDFLTLAIMVSPGIHGHWCRHFLGISF